MHVTLNGTPNSGVSAKDVILFLIQQLGVRRAAGHVLEFDGDYVSSLCMDQRLTLCNMAIEAGALSGLVGPDAVTVSYLKGKPYAPSGEQWEAAVADWDGLRSDPAAKHNAAILLRLRDVQPMLTWGTGLDQAIAVTERIPNPDQFSDNALRQRATRALRYMGLEAGEPIAGTEIDVAFIGSCNSSRLYDLRAAAAVLKGNKVRVPTIIVPGAQAIRRQAEEEGLANIFIDAGCEWREPGCSMCVGSNGDTVSSGLRCASSSPRNFEGRQGPGARTHVMSAAMVAAAAVAGQLHDVREFITGYTT
jgi:3-isopropylmalate/(R)-2-methylmalate dehydratase large subunit